jgi:hexosaminidase
MARKESASYEQESPPAGSQEILKSAFYRTLTNIFSEQFVPHKFHARNAEYEPSLDDTKNLSNFIKKIIVKEYRTVGQEKPQQSLLDEAYTLHLSEDGHITIKITSYKGGLHALASLSQLFFRHSMATATDIVYTPYAPVHIEDGPAFAHRGLNLDISRNRISPQDVMRTLDAMALNKFNRLHLHASDSQSWPLEIPSLPDLARKGAYDHSQIWSVADLKEVQDYGSDRGVEVYIEIDLPGHTASVHHAYPNLITAYNQQPWEPFAAEPPSGQLKLNSVEVTEFLTTLLRDLLPRICHSSSHFHIGGDELNTKAYTLDPNVNSSVKEVIRPYLQSFFDHVFSLTAAYSLTPLAWEDILLEWELELPKSTIIQAWRSHASLAAIVAKGHRALFGACNDWYLDCGLGSWVDPDTSNYATSVKRPFLDWCNPFKNWRHVYTYDPLEGIPEEHKHLVLGGEVHLWGELTDSTTLDFMLWPRAAAAAEVLWKGHREVSEDTTRRLAEMRERLVARGIRSGMVQMEWCLKNPGGCLL